MNHPRSREAGPVLLLALLLTAPCALAKNPAAVISVDCAAGRHPIHPLIYGVAHAGSAALHTISASSSPRAGPGWERASSTP
jgi:hypothetical protein